MSGGLLVVVAVAGAAGALLRHELTTGRRLAALHAVNVAGSLLLGVAVALEPRGGTDALALGGFGALTSFSTWMVGAHAEVLAEDVGGWARLRPLARHVVVPATLAVTAAGAGLLGTVALVEAGAT